MTGGSGPTPWRGKHGLHTYWVPVKADLKCPVWHRQDLEGTGLTEAAQKPASWCLGMGADATSGWPGTDWIEDILLQQEGPTVYNQWATGRLAWDSGPVERVFATWKRIVKAGDKQIAGHALTTDYGDASKGLESSSAPCGLEHQSGFIRDSAAWRQAHGTYAHSSTLLGSANLLELAPAHTDNAWEVSGDLAAVFNSTPQSQSFIRYLTKTSTQRDWNTEGTGFSVDGKVKSSDYADATTRNLSDTLRDPKATHCWDSLAAMPPIVRDAFTRAVVRYLAEPQDLDAQLASIRRRAVGHRGRTQREGRFREGCPGRGDILVLCLRGGAGPAPRTEAGTQEEVARPVVRSTRNGGEGAAMLSLRHNCPSRRVACGFGRRPGPGASPTITLAPPAPLVTATSPPP